MSKRVTLRLSITVPDDWEREHISEFVTIALSKPVLVAADDSEIEPAPYAKVLQED